VVATAEALQEREASANKAAADAAACELVVESAADKEVVRMRAELGAEAGRVLVAAAMRAERRREAAKPKAAAAKGWAVTTVAAMAWVTMVVATATVTAAAATAGVAEVADTVE
jgi:hypothetical protein